MARQLSLFSATLLTAGLSGLMPVVADRVGPPPPPPQNIMPAPALPSTAASTMGMTTPAAVSMVSPNSSSLPVNTSLEVPHSGIMILNLDVSARLAFRTPDGKWSQTQAVYPLFRNTTGDNKTIAARLFAQDRTGHEIKCVKLEPPSFSVQAHSPAFQTMTLQLCNQEQGHKTEYPLTGFVRLIVTPVGKTEAESDKDAKRLTGTSEPGVSFIPFSILEPATDGCAATLAFLIPLTVAVAVVLITIVSLAMKGIHLKNRMGGSTWSFGQSWGANVAIAGALLGAVLTATIFPDHPDYMSRSSYTMLQVLFAAIIGLAPLIYALIRYNVTAVSNGLVSTDAQGYVIMFLISGALVLWGALGQVATLGALFLELIKSRNLPGGVGSVLLALAALLGVFLIIYGLRALYQTAKELSVPAAEAEGQPLPFPQAEGTRLLPEHADKLKPPLRVWPVL